MESHTHTHMQSVSYGLITAWILVNYTAPFFIWGFFPNDSNNKSEKMYEWTI